MGTFILKIESLQAYAASREVLLAEIVQTLSADERFVAAWLTGSLGRGDADAVSDLDLSIAVSDAHSETLCTRPEPASAQPPQERLDLFYQFGEPAIIHENNYNAPEGGTFTFVMYRASALSVDWTLIPHTKAQRPAQSRLLFDKANIPIGPAAEAQSLEERAKQASDTIAFFWMMAAVTAKYSIRRDDVFVTCWLEELHRMTEEVERLVAGQAWQYQRGSRSRLELTRAGQRRALYRLCNRMLSLMPEVVKLGGQVCESPMPAIETLLNLRNGEK
jgi:predicted nucleotidyltransferase